MNNAVASVIHQEESKKKFPKDERLIRYEYKPDVLKAAEESLVPSGDIIHSGTDVAEIDSLPLVKRAYADLGRLGVFWHTQGSEKSYSMAFFAEKVRCRVPGNFTFVIMTEREDLDDQIYKTFIAK